MVRREIKKLTALGDAAPARPEGTHRIPQHHAPTFEDALYILGGTGSQIDYLRRPTPFPQAR